MSAQFTVACPKCGKTGTFTTGVAKSGTGVGVCRHCRKNVQIQVDGKGNVIAVK